MRCTSAAWRSPFAAVVSPSSSASAAARIVRTPDGWRISRRQERRRTRSVRESPGRHTRAPIDAPWTVTCLNPVDPVDGFAILDVLARYADVIDNAAWDRLGTVFTPDVVFGGTRSTVHGWAGIAA